MLSGADARAAGSRLFVVMLYGISIFGAVLLIWGLIGRRVATSPRCRACRYDLSGSGDAATCPECGAVLSADMVTHHTRKRRRWAIVVAVIVCVAAGMGYVQRAGKVNWIKYAPTVLLLRFHSPEVVSELHWRMVTRGWMSETEAVAAVNAGLKAQADLNRPWLKEWGYIVEEARFRGMMTDEQWSKYVEQSVAGMYSLRMRPRVRRGDPVPYELNLKAARLGYATFVGLRRRYWANLAGRHDEPVDEWRSEGLSGDSDDLRRGVEPWDAAAWGELSVGPQKAVMAVEIRILSYHRGWKRTDPPVATVTLTAETTWELVDEPTVWFNEDLATSDAIAQSMHMASHFKFGRGQHLQVDNPPCDAAFAWSIVQDDVAVPVYDLRVRRGVTMGYGFDHIIGRIKHRRGDMVLTPSLEAAARTVDLTEVWGGEPIVLRDVKVK